MVRINGTLSYIFVYIYDFKNEPFCCPHNLVGYGLCFIIPTDNEHLNYYLCSFQAIIGFSNAYNAF